MTIKKEMATLAGGCFWCTEAIFQRLKGVTKVTPGYSGGWIENPTYEQVCGEKTGHAESIQIEFNPAIISFPTLLDIFFHLHDPTTINRQGNDVGPQYRSVIFYHSRQQKETAEKIIKQFQNSGKYPERIVTQVTPFTNFYRAENYHQNYYQRNSYQPYCQIIIDPKIKKLMNQYRENIK
ncbi:peptide-methionine (S)-S-oxide reductase MsrA [Candidatus Microgenomates bacterium]|nr:peptide-methionine (S)-S-oxide reductase MsrA [Candidatus Microgenomates bacterium]